MEELYKNKISSTVVAHVKGGWWAEGKLKMEYLFRRVFFFVWGFSSHLRIFHLYGDVTIAGEGLQILTYARHVWPLSSEGSLACHT